MPAIENLSPKGLRAVTPSDTVDQGAVIGLYCTAAGAVKFTDRLGNTTTLTMAVGQELWLQIRLIWATGTVGTVLAYAEA